LEGSVLPSTALIVYDGDCPFCSFYVKLLRLKKAVAQVNLINAREHGTIIEDIQQRHGVDLNQGMVLILDGKAYHGADCLNRLALLSTPWGIVNRVNAYVFRSRAVSIALYPILRMGRDLTLVLLGRSKIRRGEAQAVSRGDVKP
jgi:predicted DCC family thiol-disulfide oxidoreductase YuxK